MADSEFVSASASGYIFASICRSASISIPVRIYRYMTLSTTVPARIHVRPRFFKGCVPTERKFALAAEPEPSSPRFG